MMFAADNLNSSDLSILFVLLCVIAFGVAIYLAYVKNYVGAVVAAFIGVVLVVLTL